MASQPRRCCSVGGVVVERLWREKVVWRSAEALMHIPRVEFAFVPNMLLRFVADDGREFCDYPNFGEWVKELPLPQQRQIVERSHLSRKQCRNLWAWLGRGDARPKSLTIYAIRHD